MSLVASLLRADTVLLDVAATGKAELFEAASTRLAAPLHLAEKVIAQSLGAREKLGSTALGQGVAIPHGRIKQLKQAVIAFVRTRDPVPFDAPDGEAVRLLFILLVPEQATDLHLQILSELAQRLSDRRLREQLLAAPDVATVLRLMSA